jgi:hypothetical protein
MAAGGLLVGIGAERGRERVAVSALELEGRNSGDVGGFGILLAGKRKGNGARWECADFRAYMRLQSGVVAGMGFVTGLG